MARFHPKTSNHHQIMRHGIIITPLGMCYRRCHCLSSAATSGGTRPVWRCFATRENKITDFLAAREQNGTTQQPGITRYPQGRRRAHYLLLTSINRPRQRWNHRKDPGEHYAHSRRGKIPKKLSNPRSRQVAHGIGHTLGV